METVEYLKRMLAGAPVKVSPFAQGLRGWVVGKDKCYICVSCAARILARGCAMPTPADPVWDKGPSKICELCAGGETR